MGVSNACTEMKCSFSFLTHNPSQAWVPHMPCAPASVGSISCLSEHGPAHVLPIWTHFSVSMDLAVEVIQCGFPCPALLSCLLPP